MDGVPRAREWKAAMEVDLTFSYTHSATCRDRDDAYAIGCDSLDESDMREAISWASLDWSPEHVSADRG